MRENLPRTCRRAWRNTMKRMTLMLLLALTEGGEGEIAQDLQACVEKHNEKDDSHALAGFDGRR